ncbi:hypothetical protein [Methanoculleus sp.]|jgi:hypothetical protein|uniref:hypothetical protein n=1 Tax=Methanoculleus sp. TaxID=90427 RepID=UPI00345CD6D3
MPSPTRPPAAVDDCTGPGEGVIEVTVVTNTGREFVYRQESENGTFIIPYSTTGSPYDVKTPGTTGSSAQQMGSRRPGRP